ncbi:DNA-directed RNA polymerase specialized sigma subunit, sigma24 family [Catalinimonas alkaloidigena]|uniref:DNA-directed RNA polymerase specialized sigma subunit, sigma24 family n=1 Tax=Catalinimonas alkaloidigena TaxID=1075417 RepID=A0A1G9LSS2_9BACT|nr:sigma-70 family RNA polymerase sigma factor [Catalinimonas alkaloidigena]SDL64824.1 DNA-directed RNA polymerase specialized sigma subunit, sigma24 family [Catalinimonas alkaloidigena]
MTENLVLEPVVEDQGAVREALFLDLYQRAFPVVARYVGRRGGSFDEAKDVFQDALVIYYEKRVAGTLTLHASDKSYLVGIAKYLWGHRYREEMQHVSLDLTDDWTGEEAAAPSSTRLLRFLETAGQKCMELLRAFYYDQLPLREIATQFGYAGVRSATVRKYKCLEKVRDTVKEKSLQYEDFFD